MKYSTKLSDAIHLLLFIHLNPKNQLSSASIAESIRTNPAFVRQMMSALSKAGLITSHRGIASPTLNRALSEITVFDVYRAVEGSKPLLHLDTHTNPECGIGVKIQYAIGDIYEQIQEAAETAMKSRTLADVLQAYESRLSSPLS